MNNRQKARERVQSFIQNDKGKWEQSPELQNVLGIMQEHTDTPIDIQMAPSPMMLGPGDMAQPAWGSGGGVFNRITGEAFVDPLAHPTVGAHEAAHQAFPSEFQDEKLWDKDYENISNPDNYTPEMINKGALIRMFHEHAKLTGGEEAYAQGVATRAMHEAGLEVDTSGWPDMHEYPIQHKFGGIFNPYTDQYKANLNKSGVMTYSPEEVREIGRIDRSTPFAVERNFNKGYSFIPEE